MAQISDAVLSMFVNGNPIDEGEVVGPATVEVVLTYQIFTSGSEDKGIVYREVARLFGNDAFLTFQDDPIPDGVLLDTTISHSPALPGGAVTPRFLRVKLPSRNLNEDSGGDEIFARITLTPTGSSGDPVSRRSNVIKASFR